MATRMDVAEVRVENVRPGMSLAVEEGGHLLQFNVEEVGFRLTQGEESWFTLKSEPLENGEPWVLEYPAGTVVTLILRKYDDAT